MDIFSHGLYGGVAFGRKTKREYWTAFFFGIAPDLFSFGIFTASVWLGLASGPDWDKGPPDPSLIPEYVYSLYDVTHSLIVFLAVFFAVWLIRKRPYWLIGGWGLHILVDIFTHSEKFFPTPFLWPLSDYHFDGKSWGEPLIFIPNLIVLACLYGYWWWLRKKQKNASVAREGATEEWRKTF